MRGRIYSDEKCPKCGGQFNNDTGSSLVCAAHPRLKASGKFKVRFGRQVTKRFSSYKQAQRFLDGLRFQVDQDTFNPGDWKKDHPLGFATLAMQWLEVKEGEVKPKTLSYYRNYVHKAIAAWGQTNIRQIGYGEIEDFLKAQDVSKKTQANIRACLHGFWQWLRRRQTLALHELPEFPEVSYELGFRRIVDKETQQKIIDEVYRISFHVNSKIWLGIKWLSTYISIRPGELLRVREEDIDLGNGFLSVRFPKEKKPKTIPLLPEDIEILKTIPRGLPHLSFFRHNPSYSSAEGRAFGEKYFYKWWKRACANLGIEGVDLYGGTRHSSARALRKHHSPEAIKRATLHSTNKAFERYFCFEDEDVLEVYADAQKPRLTNIEYNAPSDQPLTNRKRPRKKAKVLKFK